MDAAIGTNVFKKIFDAAVVGAGPAGLSAALFLGRARRSVIVIDSGNPRNAVSRSMHGFISREGIRPDKFLALCRQEILAYSSICFLKAHVTGIQKRKNFSLEIENQETICARKILLATGRQDEIPAVPGFRELFGHGVFLCPYCDAWEMRDQPIAVYGKKERGPDFALTMRQWSKDLVLLSDGPVDRSAKEKTLLLKIKLIEKKIMKIEGHGWLDSIVFEDGSSIKRKAVFFNTPCLQKSSLAVKTGCKFTQRGGIKTDTSQFTGIPGIYAAGDACDGIKMVITAAAQGTTAAFSINSELFECA